MSDMGQHREQPGRRVTKTEDRRSADGERPRSMRLLESEQREDWETSGSAGGNRRREREGTKQNRQRPAGNGEERRGRGDSGSTEEKNWKVLLRERKQKRIRRALLCGGVLLAVVYIAVAIYFGFHFYEGTEIYGIVCSQKTADEVKAEVADRLLDYRLEIGERADKTEYLTAQQIGLAFVDNHSIDRMLRAQYSFIWPVMILMDRSEMATVAFSYDEDAAVAAFESLECMNPIYVTAPQDAYVKVTEEGFSVEPEVMGTTLDREKTQREVLHALDSGSSTLVLEEQGCYVDPEVYEDDEELQRIAAEKNELARANITYDFGDRQEIVNAPVIADWIVTMSDGSYVIDDVSVTNYVEQLAETYDTFGLPREFYTSIGTTVTLTGGDYGWCIDQDATVVALLNALADGYQGTMEPEYLYTAMSRDTNDIGYTYVEVCISQQRMWCYENGTCIVDTPVVTGNPNKGNGTPSGGVWAIDAKKRNAVLVGEGYQSPVDYWMPFNGDVGIHDMQTRAYFGSTIYLTNGSHGCVNTPYEQAKMIYNAVSIGTPVIVYE